PYPSTFTAMSSYLYHLPSGLQSSVSGLFNSDLAYIQEGDWFPELSHLVKVTAPHDIDTNLDNRKFRDEGEKLTYLYTQPLILI
ncbi:MAG: hypothetical protein ACKO86_07050, partial [Dolichospermum sp.]